MVLEFAVEFLRFLYRSAKRIAERFTLVRKLKASVSWGVFRHRIALAIEERNNSTFTGFLRLPTQFEALQGPVLDFVRERQGANTIRIVVVGCSNGAEAYTIASIMKVYAPHAAFMIDAYDINSEFIEKARTGRYAEEEVLNNKLLPVGFIQTTFRREGPDYCVREDILACVRFDVADALSPDLDAQVGLCDVLFAQNFLFHLSRRDATRAFGNLCALLKPNAAIFVDGMDIGLRQKLTRNRGLVPLDYKIAEIHNEARRARESGWPYRYWGLEPFMSVARDWRRRYATIFVRGGEAVIGQRFNQGTE